MGVHCYTATTAAMANLQTSLNMVELRFIMNLLRKISEAQFGGYALLHCHHCSREQENIYDRVKDFDEIAE